MAKLTLQSTLALPKSSLAIPRLGFGVYESHRDTCIKSCLHALKSGYRHIDSAQYYANEAQVGDAVAQSGVPREEVYLTTKVLSPGKDVDETYEGLVESVKKLGGKSGYVDLFLIHSPNGGAAARKNMWLALERLLKEGKTKAIGVSNFGKGHIEQLKEYATTWPPHVNQIEVCSITTQASEQSLTRIAAPLEPAARGCNLLSTARHRRRSILSTRPQPKGRGQDPQRHRQEAR